MKRNSVRFVAQKIFKTNTCWNELTSDPRIGILNQTRLFGEKTMQGQQSESAVSSEAVESGVTNDVKYETLVAEMHGLGKRHRCDDSNCPRCTKSTAGENFEKAVRASTVYDGQDARPPHERTEPEYNDPAIAAGAPDEVLRAIEGQEHDPDACRVKDCPKCSVVTESLVRPDYTIQKGGGSSSGRKRGRPPKFRRDSQYQEILSSDTRPAVLSGRVSDDVHDYVQAGSAGASAGEILEMVVSTMIEAGCGVETIKMWLDERAARIASQAA